MPICQSIPITNSRICTGDLRYTIKIFTRKLIVPDITKGEVDAGEAFELLHELHAAIATPVGKTTFKGVDIVPRISHIFYVRFLSNISTEDWIEYANNRYDIVKLTNFETRGWFLKLETMERGNIDEDATRA